MNFFTAIPVIGDLIDSLTKGIDEIFTSDEERGKIDVEKKKIELQELATQLKAQHAQLQINLVQANHRSIFVAGARPAIIWIGAIGLAYEAILRPIFSWIATRFATSYTTLESMKEILGAAATQDQLIAALQAHIAAYQFPNIETSLFMPIVMGVLGIGGMRTWEKLQGKARETLNAGESEYKQLATNMVNRMKAQEQRFTEAKTGNPTIDNYKKIAAEPGFKPYYPDINEIL